ncbi:MAG: hypothetical protein ACLFVP_10100 [Candidatus Bathyarchaeia archaeon]
MVVDEDNKEIEQFKCPVEGCGFTTRFGPGAIRMHILLSSDPDTEARYDESHEEFYKAHKDELSLETVRYFTEFPIRGLQSS